MATIKTVTIYDKNGNEMEIRASFAEAYLKTGWSKKPPKKDTPQGVSHG